MAKITLPEIFYKNTTIIFLYILEINKVPFLKNNFTFVSKMEPLNLSSIKNAKYIMLKIVNNYLNNFS